METLQARVTLLQNAQNETQNQLALLQDREHNTREDWLVLEADYLIKLAAQQLSLQRDVPTAIKALQAADDRLRQSPHPAIIAVRKAIAEDLRALRAVPVVDTVGISVSLSAISDDVAQLPLRTPAPERTATTSTSSAESRRVDSWSALPRVIWADLKSLIVIHNHPKPVTALLAPEQRFFLFENLRLQLEQARLALLSGEEEIYKERIKTASNWLQEYFDTNAKATTTTLQTLQQLQHQSIAPALPDLSRSYKAIEHYTKSQDRTVKNIRPAANGNHAP
jgi:uroporphyrin-3 C-methyltransferase